MPYAFHLEDDGTLDPEAKIRSDKALRIAENNQESIIVLAAGWQKYAEQRGVASLAHAAMTYLKTKGWPQNRMRVSPEGYNTVTETAILYRVTLCDNNLFCPKYVVTSWWHKPRVWLVCRILFPDLSMPQVYATRTTRRGLLLVRDMLRECIAIPKSVFEAFKMNKTLQYIEKMELNLRHPNH